ncbi:AraC family transcriptional regulator [Cohnella soli]|uniref:AraC family transcriptional regulator n=1 Tax=Cohnella soli TaxID=425005 RepID=A0ABW0I0Z6_9BACL
MTAEERFITAMPGKPIQLYYCGHQICSPGHSYGPAMRDHVLLHYVRSGKGRLWINGGVYELTAGQIFTLFPNVPGRYQANDVEPWHYSWVGFDGRLMSDYLAAAGITPESPIYTFQDASLVAELFDQLFDSIADDSMAGEALGISYLLQLIAYMLKESRLSSQSRQPASKRSADEFIQRSILLIRTNYSRKLTVSMMAKHVGLERSYFSKCFREQLGKTPYDFLTQYRMEQAVRMLIHTLLAVGTIAASVGYEDLSHFSKAFMKYASVSPTEFRNRHRHQQ